MLAVCLDTVCHLISFTSAVVTTISPRNKLLKRLAVHHDSNQNLVLSLLDHSVVSIECKTLKFDVCVVCGGSKLIKNTVELDRLC
jgi:hypothetical protein